jgi:hypothetical protein
VDLTQLANLGEFIGGVAVIGSLIFVGLQIRLNAGAVRQNSTHGAIETWASMNMALAQDEGLASLVSKVLDAGASDDLDDGQFARISCLIRAMCMRLEAEYFLYSKGAMEGELWRKHLSVARSMIQSPIGRLWWSAQAEAEEHMYTDRFIVELEGNA